MAADRSFALLREGDSPETAFGRGRRYLGGGVDWATLLQYPRVVVLAEASAGKTWELREQAKRLTQDGEAAFFLRIDDLAEGPFEDGLDTGASTRFERWRREGNADGWFFLDSVDEARLNRKSFEGALRRLGKELGAALARARIVISCRASDWRVREDPAVIREFLPLPLPEMAPATATEDENIILLERVFPPKEDKTPEAWFPREEVGDLFIAQLLPLDVDQQRSIAHDEGVTDLDGFMAAVVRSGLDELAERPGDLISLVAYWRDRKGFGSLAEMTAHGIEARLAELDPFRPDNDVLSPERAKRGTERLAAALTFGQAFTLLATGAQADPSLAAGALDPRRILPEFRDDERQALVRRGIFAPSTYGRLRFHHRTAQEYLAAAWLRRLHVAGCPLSRIWDLIFAERYGVETVVPSLRATAAWLSLWIPDVRDELVRREPLTLLLHGDPKSLPLATRETLLSAWAAKSKAGALSHAYIDDRALWLFADPALVSAMRAAWAVSDQGGLRTDLLRCVREGRLAECADLARGSALDSTRSDSERMAAADALAELGDRAGLAEFAEILRGGPRPSFRLVTTVARLLFPAVIGAEPLVAILGRCQLEEDREFSTYLPGILREAPAAERLAFAYAVAAAAGGRAPDDDDETAGDQRYRDMLTGCVALIVGEVEAVAEDEAPARLLDLLGALRSDKVSIKSEREALLEAVAVKPALNRAVFWRGAEGARTETFNPRHIRQMGWRGGWWSLNETDLGWLRDDLRVRSREEDRVLILDAIIYILRRKDAFEIPDEAARLDALVASDPTLKAELARYREPPPPDPEEPKWKARHRREEAKQRAQLEAAKASWVRFKNDVKSDRGKLTDPVGVGLWTGTGAILYDLARWLSVDHEGVYRSPLRWRDLSQAFGEEVAEAFYVGMTALWRAVAPRRPRYSAENQLSTWKMNELALGALNLEASRDPEWIDKLSDDEVRRAAFHAAYAEHHFPDWVDELVTLRPAVALPVLVTCLGQEWGRKWGRNELLLRSARGAADPALSLTAETLRLLIARRPASVASLSSAVTILGRARLSVEQRVALLRCARRRWKADGDPARAQWARLDLALMFVADPTLATETFAGWLQAGPLPQDIRATFVLLFGREASVLHRLIWAEMPVRVLVQLVRLAYHHVGSSPPPTRRRRVVTTSDDAEGARNALLSALLERTGPDVFSALQAMSAEPGFAASARRLAELAHDVAERATERPAWTEAETAAFERDHVAPVKSGADLYRVVVGILQEMQHQFTRGDSHPGAALHRLATEEELQHWLSHELNLRAQGRFKASRETQVAQGNKPDVVVTAHAAPVEVALEIKHGDKPAWTSNKLYSTLSDQLAEQYLLPENRRHGVLVVSHHGRRTWKDPDTRKTWTFGDLTQWLQAEAARIHENRAGGVQVTMLGLDPGIDAEPKVRR